MLLPLSLYHKIINYNNDWKKKETELSQTKICCTVRLP